MQRLNSLLRRVPVSAVYLAGLLPLGWIVWQVQSGGYGPDPVRGIERGLGLWAVRLLIATLCVTPLRWAGLNLLRFRRQLGLVGFGYVVLHLCAWISVDMAFRWSQIVEDITRRPYLILGMAAFLVLLPLALTSSNAAIRWLGAARWRRLHRLAYAGAILAILHFLMVGKVYQPEVLAYAAVLAALLALRIHRDGPAALFRA